MVSQNVDGEPRTRSGPLETVAAWLGVWTPPRDVHVPPRPSRRQIALTALLLAAAVGGAVALAAPLIEASKDRAQRAEGRRLDEVRARRQALQRVEQRPRRRRLPAGATPRQALRAVESPLLQDARARFDGRATAARCQPHPPTSRPRDTGTRVAAYAFWP